MSPLRTLAPGPGSRIVALLGPTNTGKTHHALERMLQFPTGIIGLPLRLLAREVYDKLTASLGERAVALITGEEKRIGARARYFVCTVEAMPTEREVDFIAVDEIQLAAHPERGHVFTQRLLRSRGRQETWFLGAETIAPLLSKLVPTATIERRTRLSVLSGRGQMRLNALPKRSAIIAFSVPEVFRLAQLLKQRRGGAAVVLGNLSPRARNAQVALYESGEVNYVVATDAIGMGLNLNIRHIAFASIEKFDGRQRRRLEAAELAQIAGRAGRHLQSGTFGTLAPQPNLRPHLQRQIESHRFAPLTKLTWRNDDLCLDSPALLYESLRVPSPIRAMTCGQAGSDLRALGALLQDEATRKRAVGRQEVELLWQVCQIPDYGQGVPHLHTALIKQVFGQLIDGGGRLDPQWLSNSLRPLNNPLGDIDTLSARVSGLRTWAYLCNQPAWLDEPQQWREQCDALECRLSDALHARLVEQFVSSAQATLFSSAKPDDLELLAKGSWSTTAMSSLASLRQQLSPPEPVPLSPEGKVENIIASDDGALRCGSDGCIYYEQIGIALLRKGHSRILPEVTLTLDPVTQGQHLQLSRRLLAWSRDLVDALVEPLRKQPLQAWSPAGRGLLYQLEQSLGSIPTRDAKDQLALLTRADRVNLKRARVHLGKFAIYCHGSCDVRWDDARRALCIAFAPARLRKFFPSPLPASFRPNSQLNSAALAALGYLTMGPVAIRSHLVERLSRLLAKTAAQGAFCLPVDVIQWLNCNRNELIAVLGNMGFRPGADALYRSNKKRNSRRRKSASTPKDS